MCVLHQHRKCGTGEGGWVLPKGENSVVVSGLGLEKPFGVFLLF